MCLQGYTGLLNTPTANTSPEGRVSLLFSDQVEKNRSPEVKNAENFLLSIGLLPNVELSGRLTEEHPAGIRDLSANLKIQLPYFNNHPYLPRLAAGIQDIGGGAPNFRTRYLVASKQIHSLQLNLGYGIGPDRLDGMFGGLEFQAFDWLHFLGEYDTEATNLGLRVQTPNDRSLIPDWGAPFNLPLTIGITAKTSLQDNDKDLVLAFMLQMPLGGRDQTKPTKTSLAFNHVPLPKETVSQETAANPVYQLKNHLTDLGFENLRLGTIGDNTLYIEYENSRYNHNELDGLGLLLGIAATEAPTEYQHLAVVIKKLNTPILEIDLSVAEYRNFLLSGAPPAKSASGWLIKKTTTTREHPVHWLTNSGQPGWFIPRIQVYPGLRTFVATEYGVLDYFLSLKTEFHIPLYRGLELNARYSTPLTWSNDLEDGKIWASYREDANLDRLMLHQSFKLAPDLMTLFSVGKYIADNNGVLNETIWSPGRGTHRLQTTLGYFDDSAQKINRKIFLGSYRYYHAPLDLIVEGTYGQFWYQDKGVVLALKRFFGDTLISVFCRVSGDNGTERVGGLSISLPLSPQRDMKPSILQIKGSDAWTYGLETVIADQGDRNPVRTDIGIIPTTNRNLDRVYFNRDRLNERYIEQHIMRLREAYERWSTGE